MSTRREFLEQAAGCALLPLGGETDMQDTDQMLVNEVHRLDRAVAQRRQHVANLAAQLKEHKDSRLKRRPRRYSVEFEFDPNQQVTPPSGQFFVPPSVTRSFVVDGGTTFRCSQIETSFRVVGQSRIAFPNPRPGQVAQLTLPYGVPGADAGASRQSYFDFTWRIFDTGSDREWQNDAMPSMFLLSGPLSAMYLPVRGEMAGGSEVSVEVNPIFFDFTAGGTLFNTVSRFVLHFSFEGHEVRS